MLMRLHTLGDFRNIVSFHGRCPKPWRVVRLLCGNASNRAKQEQETLINEAWQQYNKKIYNIEGTAQRMINEAEGYAIERVNNAITRVVNKYSCFILYLLLIDYYYMLNGP